ncbi:glucose 1-dehydrogenase [Amycolatopsis sp. NBC_00345]|uniref:SDR family NAD(P)-dependent oxidoreductase n=1 Tax=Amycolatopsis sp. NBC_00345 TaxID=2975955 RepID=UPI002E274139
MVDLQGRVAVVTGGGKGIGRGISACLAAAGAAVVVNYATDRTSAEQTVAGILAKGGRAVAVAGDVGAPDGIDHLFTQAHAAFGPVDTLVNNAAVFAYAPLSDITPEEFDRHYRTNVLGVFLACRAFVAQAPGTGGSIITIATSDITANQPGSALYTSTKGAVATLTRSLAKELGSQRIRVNAVAPGATDTEGSRGLGLITDDNVARVAAITPLGRLGRPDDIGPVVAFLASADAGWVTGDVLYASGGLR